jgi:hypothetical protein
MGTGLLWFKNTLARDLLRPAFEKDCSKSSESSAAQGGCRNKLLGAIYQATMRQLNIKNMLVCKTNQNDENAN